MIKKLMGAFVVFSLVGCLAPVNQDIGEGIRSQRILVEHKYMPQGVSFAFKTFGNTVADAALMSDVSRAMNPQGFTSDIAPFTKAGVEHPMKVLYPKLRKMLSEKSHASLTVWEMRAKTEEELRKKSEALKAEQKNYPWLLELQQDRWGIKYSLTAPGSYFIYAHGQMRFEKTGQSKSVYYLRCQYKSEKNYSYDELVADDAAVVKKELNTAASQCLDQLSSALYG